MLMINLAADFQFGKELFEDGLYEEAILEFEKIISLSPTSEDAQQSLFYIGECFFEQKKFLQAEEKYLSLLDGYPNNSFKDKILYKLALSQFKQAKLNEALLNFDTLIDKYPLSKFTELSLPYYIQSFFEQKNYETVIVKGQKLIKDYEKSSQVPEILFWMAKAYFSVNKRTECENTLKRILSEFPNAEIRWKSLLLGIDLIAETQGIQNAADTLSLKLKTNIPRQFEEELRLKLIDYYFVLEQYESAFPNVNELIQKFDNSLQLDFYIILKTECQLKLKKIEEILKEEKDFRKVFKESDLKENYELNLARAEYRLRNYEKANNRLDEILADTKNDSIIYECKFLRAGILENTGKFSFAINQLQDLLDSDFSQKDQILFNIGNIYFEKFKNHRTAITHYQQITSQFSQSDFFIPAIYKTALCYEKFEKNNEAIRELSKIDRENENDKQLKAEISAKKEYLTKFKQKDFESGFYNLLHSIYFYLEDDNKEKLQYEVISILVEDIKNIDQIEELISSKTSPEYIYLQANIYLYKAERAKYESKDFDKKSYLLKAGEKIDLLNPQTHKMWFDELKIEKDLHQEQETNHQFISRMERFIEEFPDTKKKNKFLLEIIRYYSNQKDKEKTYLFAEKLILDKTIERSYFFKLKLDLAAYYFQKKNYKSALKNYHLAESKITIDQPQTWFDFAVTLSEQGQKNKAISKLEFLVNNAEDFKEFLNAVKYLVQILHENENFTDAVKYSQLIPGMDRDDDYYLDLSNDYLKIGNKEKAKEYLLHIKEKDIETLRKLANLQFETRDYEMAKYTYNELVKKEKNNLQNYKMLAHISFLQEDFLDAAKNYKVIVDKLGENFKDYQNIRQVALENIISLYRIENRPKAETLTKKFKDILSEDDLDEIELNKGIYQIEVDPKKGEKIFKNLLKKPELKAETKIAAYFRRGIARLKQEKIEEAEVDFKTVANSIDPELSKQAHLKLGTINFSNENFQQALENYYKVIEADDDGQLAFDAAKNFAFVCKTIKEWQKAIAAYEIILERWGDSGLEAATVFDIAFCHFRDKKYMKSIEMFERAIPILNEKELQAEAHYWIGESYFGQEDYEKAISEFLKVGYNYSEFAQWTASAELRAGESYINLDKKDKAKRTFERIIDKYGKYSDWGKEASKRLESM